MKIKIKDVINFYTDKIYKLKHQEWLFLVIAPILYQDGLDEEIDVAEIEKMIPNIRKDMGLEE